MLKHSFFRCKLDGSTALTMKNRLSSSPRAESRGAVLQFFSILLDVTFKQGPGDLPSVYFFETVHLMQHVGHFESPVSKS